MAPPLIVAFAFVLFAVLHSVTTSGPFKARLARVLGEAWMRRWYRALYTVFSTVITAAAVYVFFTQPETFLFRPDWHVLLFFHLIQFFGVWLVYVAMKRAGTGSFLGLSQMFKRAGKTGVPFDAEGNPSALWTTGIYGVVRHPMYLGGIIAFLPEPNIGVNCLVLRVLATAYFIYGSVMEERRCVKVFGEEYLDYRKHVPMFNIFAGVIRAYKRQKPPHK